MSDTRNVRRWVSVATLALLALLTVASVLNIHDMAEATHTANGLPAWIVSIAIGGTLSVLAYVASITDGRTRTMSVVFAVFAATVSTALQVSLFIDRGAQAAVAVAFGVGVPFFEVALAITDSMLRRYESHAPATVLNTGETPTTDGVQNTNETPEQNTVPDSGQGKPNTRTDGVNVTQLAKQLGVSRTTVYRKLNSGELQPHLNGATGD